LLAGAITCRTFKTWSWRDAKDPAENVLTWTSDVSDGNEVTVLKAPNADSSTQEMAKRKA
jgi:hypothetical protein